MTRAKPWATSTRRQRLPADWERRRDRVRDRAGDQCEWVEDGRRCWRMGSECDHVQPGDDHDLSNLQWLCRDHHRDKTLTEQRVRQQSCKRSSERHPGLLG